MSDVANTCAYITGDCKEIPLSGADSKLCIFHLDDPNKSLASFNQDLQEKIEKFDFNFQGFVFPSGSVNFMKQHFEKGVNFEGAEFLGDVSFIHAQLSGIINFTGTIFHGNVDFSKAVFVGPVYFNCAKFYGGTSKFKWSKFRNITEFGNAIFESNNDFERAIFSNDTTFQGAIFGKEDEAGNTTFKRAEIQNIKFNACQFKHDVDFIDAKFKEQVEFNDAIFNELANFEDSKFLGGDLWCQFRKTKFIKTIKFSRSHFFTNIDFHRAEFRETAVFQNIKVKGHLRFRGYKPKEGEDIEVFQNKVYFREVRFIPNSNLNCKAEFHQTNLQQAYFLNTDVDKIEFTDVKWDEKTKGRCMVQDEEDPNPNLNRLLAQLYRKLSNNFRDSRDYKALDDFYVAALEMDRLKYKSDGLKLKAFIYWLYKIFSSYGNDYFRAFFWLLVLGLIAPSLLYFCARGEISWIEYDSAFFHSLSIATFQRTRYLSDLPKCALVVGYAQLIAVASLLSLFLLALRRRFRL